MKIYVRERTKVGEGVRQPRYIILAVQGGDLKVYAHHFRKTVAGICMVGAPLALLLAMVFESKIGISENAYVIGKVGDPDTGQIEQVLLKDEEELIGELEDAGWSTIYDEGPYVVMRP